MTRIKVTGKLAESARNEASGGVVLPLVKNHLLATHGPDPDRRQDVIHPSEMAKSAWCARATWLRITGEVAPKEEKFDFIQQNIFGEGNMIHAKWQKWLADTGKLWGVWECASCHDTYLGTAENEPRRPAEEWEGVPGEVPLEYCSATYEHMWEYKEIPLEHGLVHGHADGALVEHSSLIEVKSIGLGTLRIDAPELLARFQDKGKTDLTGLWRALERPLKSHLRQGDIYLWLANQMGLPFDRIIYLYEFKANQMVKEFTVHYSEDRVQPLVDKAKLIEYALETKQNVPCTVSEYGCDQCKQAKPRKTRSVVR